MVHHICIFSIFLNKLELISISVNSYYAFYDRRREREIQELKWQLDAATHAMDHAHRKWSLVVKWVQLLEWIQNLVQFQKEEEAEGEDKGFNSFC